MRSSWLLFAIFALFAFSSALNIGDLNLDGIEEYLNHGVKRQAQGTGNSNTTPAPTSAPPTSAAPTTRPPATTSAPAPSTNAPASSSNPPSSANNPPASSSQPAPSSQPSSASSPPRTSARGGGETSFSVETTPLVTLSTRPVTSTLTTTSNGQEVVQTTTGQEVLTSTTGMATTTRALGTQGGGGEGSSGGLSDKNKTIIGGVVGGVGGALLLGGIALVCWRMWGKKKSRVTEDDADLMAGTGSALGDKPQNNSTPFQSNLEQYHNPGGRPNAAANF